MIERTSDYDSGGSPYARYEKRSIFVEFVIDRVVYLVGRSEPEQERYMINHLGSLVLLFYAPVSLNDEQVFLRSSAISLEP